MSNKMTVIETLVNDYATHNFDEKEAIRFAGEAASEVNGQNTEGLAVLVKTAKVTAKGVTLGVSSIKIKKENMTPRIIAFSAIVNAAALSRDGGIKIRADIRVVCELIRSQWLERDAAKAAKAEAETEAAKAALTPEQLEAAEKRMLAKMKAETDAMREAVTSNA